MSRVWSMRFADHLAGSAEVTWMMKYLALARSPLALKVMVAVIPSPWDGDPHEFVRYGYPYSCESVTTEVLRGFLAKSLGAK